MSRTTGKKKCKSKKANVAPKSSSRPNRGSPSKKSKLSQLQSAATQDTAAPVRNEEPLGDVIIVVCYAKVIDDKIDGVKLAGVHFGGAAIDQPEAETIVRDCINNVRGGTILAKQWQTTGPNQIIDIMKKAMSHFSKAELQMMQNQEILARNAKK